MFSDTKEERRFSVKTGTAFLLIFFGNSRKSV
jgi:hypothetical protein